MSILSRAGDLFYAFKFLRLLTTPWEKTGAYEHGIVDENGKVLIKSRELKDPEAKAQYTVFHRLVFNLKRLLEKLPFGKTKLASYAAALFLIKEHTNMEEEELISILEDFSGESVDKTIVESMWFEKNNQLCPGTYVLNNDIVSPITGETISHAKNKIVVEGFVNPVAHFCGVNIYKVKHLNQDVFITNQDITR